MNDTRDRAWQTGLDADTLLQWMVTEQSNYVLILLDEQGYIRVWNRGVERLFGYAESEFVGRHSEVIFVPEDRAARIPEAEMATARREGRASDVRWQQRKDGTQFFGHGVMTTVRDPSGAVIGFTKVISDETIRKQLEERLLASNADLERFAAVVSHDLQEPLRTVSSYAELLRIRLKDKLDEDTAQMFEFLEQGATDLRRLVRDLLAYARLGQDETHPEPLALDEAIEVVRAHCQQAIRESGAVLTHGPLPVVMLDATQAVQLLQNLITNSIRYRNEGVSPVIHVSAERIGKEWVVKVKDNGRGFNPEDTESLFAPFQRATQHDREGSGLGLAICRRIIERNGGRIWAESAGDGQGATFSFTVRAWDHTI